ncbi:hypothetical protein DVA86_10940 [Streptomyces armeniacus]|uniref:DUF3558 domain-containing protein n=1 Tax=Streptomyces armeniacus TaxID=83291 RepID=A0A345XN75_9ACTN|nr:hypothetical protein [Streptomyces armeniacus]AXK33091.1 hypothetical protein DVA86_10940 [Streptomyces armeniacus]
MQRRARTFLTSAALVVTLTGGLSACTGSSDSGGDGGDTKPGGGSSSQTAAPPGKYRTLPEPCGEVSRDTLEQMLPGAESEDGADTDDPGSSTGPSPYEGEASVTYDTDRRVGCTWQSATSLGSRHLTVDFERVVSYDPAVSDDEQTDLLYVERAEKAGVDPSADPTEPENTEDTEDAQDSESAEGTEDSGSSGEETPDDQPGGGATPEGGKATESPGAGSDPSASDPSGSPSSEAPSGSPSTEEALPSRTLDGIGDAAFIDDELVATKSGRATHRDIKLVFRTANVLVTVEYTQSVADERRTPDSAELQEQAQELGRQLAGKFDDN